MANTFSLILTLATLITGIIWLIDRFKLAPARKKKMAQQQKVIEGSVEQTHLAESIHKPSWVDTCSSIFPILAIVLVIRSFIYEPFQIPSGSMMPTLLVGDFILVEKFAYGLKDPVTQTTLLETGKPKRGDIAVFKYPKDPSVDFVKRVIGLPGDKIVYDPEQKELRIYPNCSSSNCARALPIIYSSLKESEWALFFNMDSMVESQKGGYQIPLGEPVPTNALRQAERIEKLDDVSHEILVIPQVYTQSRYQQPGLPDNEWIVPPKHYFMMGDNRDNSADSRMWGFVPEENLVGRAVIIWFSLDKHEGEWPTGVRLSRIGAIN
ncbi:MAG TPA: signal peptidase I [Arsenophonus apicola]|uniref:signal peptidase I n=1 Tax=Arsenophonus apicola TaxID=2879119 RepID=UPI001CDB570B|nr:signal peptidase I [Arsenophonus apicola]UBX29877.1 signal peptidase I [Arsenophonus apicola]